MRGSIVTAVALTALSLGTAQAQDESRVVAGGGISVAGWMGKIDPREAASGAKLENAKLAKEGADLKVTTGPAVVYWHPSNRATGDYTVSAKFTEHKFMELNNHPHPYGLFIGGSDMGTDAQSYLYCNAYGNGTFIVRGFSGDTTFQMNGRRGEANAAVAKAAAKGDPVTQEIALSVKGDKVECSVNGTVVGTYNKADVLQPRRLKSTDGIYGIRFGHNTEATVSGLKLTRH
jgi:hypothetical protein